MYDNAQIANGDTVAAPYPRIGAVARRARRIALLGSFPPRRCGIATFTADVYASLVATGNPYDIDVIAMDDGADTYVSGGDVTATIRQDVLDDYLAAAKRLNARGVDTVCIQHEFGIFGGPAGDYLLTFLAALHAPIITTLHTVLDRPTDDQRRVMETLLHRSARIIVMAERAREILIGVYKADPASIAVIPHGAPDHAFETSTAAKARHGFAGRDVLMTFGLLSPNKGLDDVIRALPKIVEARSNALYVIVGATHPHLLRREGEAYRESLIALARELGVEAHLHFVNAYLDNDALIDHLRAADVYVTPYKNKAQITSGTLAYAVAMGKAIVSTPYWHAAEALAGDVGVLVEFGDEEALARALRDLLANDALRHAYRRRAYRAGRETVWAKSAQRYAALFEDVGDVKRRLPALLPAQTAPDLSAVKRMTDACGMLQHAVYCLPDRAHGYCIDDNARALILMQKLRALGSADADIDRLEIAYAAFINHGWNEAAGRFRNFMSYERVWLEESGSDDSNGRAFWSLGETARGGGDPELRDWALNLARRTAAPLRAVRSPRAQAFLILGAAALLDAAPKDAAMLDMVENGAAVIAEAFQGAQPEWTWLDPALTYDNARIPLALLTAGRKLGDADITALGLDALTWLTARHTSQAGYFQPVGNETFDRPYTPPRAFDQQPLEATAAIEAAWAAYEVTGDRRWADEARRAYAWFTGGNTLLTPLAVGAGGCYDGLSRRGPNRNQGAESILSLQLAHCEMALRTIGPASSSA